MHFSTATAILFALSSSVSGWVVDIYDTTDCAQSGGQYYALEGSGESSCMVLPGKFGSGVDCHFFKDGGFDGPHDCGSDTFTMPASHRYRDAYCTIWQDGSCGQDGGHIIGEGTGNGCDAVNPNSKWGSFKCRSA
ncbi:hypothetical protein LA080_005393 [Diaporthe eres]|uniref:Secreted LysM effector LysM C-terminal domain-containing protein n=1 Tax=Diaporthe vaccinii TaxID=105482 RepID=A0ABR4EWD7_9PEZI|nr:hypothetical protein LA080_005393 [Diaporthe eres]